MRFLLQLWCRMIRHKWGKAFVTMKPPNLAVWEKECRRCHTVAPVKRRTVK
jgi:hypothetical protein